MAKNKKEDIFAEAAAAAGLSQYDHKTDQQLLGVKKTKPPIAYILRPLDPFSSLVDSVAAADGLGGLFRTVKIINDPFANLVGANDDPVVNL